MLPFDGEYNSVYRTFCDVYCKTAVKLFPLFISLGASQLVTRSTRHSPNYSDELTVWQTGRVTSWLWRHNWLLWRVNRDELYRLCCVEFRIK